MMRLLYYMEDYLQKKRMPLCKGSKIEKLRRIFSSNNLKITVKDSAKKKTYKCSIGSSSTQVMLDILNDYKSILKKYKK